MLINFTKMHSLGNDFIIIDAITQNVKLNTSYIKKIADRHIGIGCDQLIVLDPPINPLADFYYRIYNSDGKSAEQCINGVRCAARFALDNGLVKKNSMIAESVSGQIILNINEDHIVSANLGIINPKIKELSFKLSQPDILITVYNVSIGNKHAICIINNFTDQEKFQNLEQSIYTSIANQIACQKELYPQGINIGFVKILDKNHMQLRVFERGSGETLACGSNAAAAFLVARQLNLIDEQLEIIFNLGALNSKLLNQELIIQGPVNSIFCGKFKI